MNPLSSRLLLCASTLLPLSGLVAHAADPAPQAATPKAAAPASGKAAANPAAGAVKLGPAIGHVHAADGGALRMRGNEQSPLQSGDTIQSGDVLSTDQGTVTVLLSDGKLKAAVRLKPGTSVRITHSAGKGFETELKRGIVFSDVHNPDKKRDAFQVRTSTAVMGVRGTIFLVKEIPATAAQGGSAQTTFLCPCVGKVAVTSASSKGAKGEQVLTGTHHDRPVTIQASGGALKLTDAPMGEDHSDTEAAELEKILSGASG
jgi:hypothetical protein